MKLSLVAVAMVGVLGVAVGAQAAGPGEPSSPSSANATLQEPRGEAAPALPSTCGADGTFKDTKLCMPERAFAKKLCTGVYPEVALGLFTKGTPFTRIYLAGDVEAWNASGGRTHRTKLAFDEEVLVLAKNGAGASGGIVMTGAQASYDVLRWDGSCVSVMEGEVTARKPPAPKPADVAFSRLEESTRHALLATPKVKATHAALFKACASSTSITASAADKKACEKADRAFSLAIVDAVRAGVAALPAPGRRP